MSAPKPLPEKICITGRGINLANFKKAVREKHANASTRGLELEPDDLTPEARAKYDAYYTEKARRKDPAQPGVAQEALDALEHCRANKLSTNLLHQCGYSTRATVKLAVAEEKRIVRELSAKASKDVVQNIDCKLVVADVMTKHAIEEYVKPVEPEPEKPVVEPKGEAKGEAKVEVTEPK